MKPFLLLSLIFFFSSLRAQTDEKLSVVVIGGGPAGLGCAIEAALQGYNVTVVEKRNEYTRSQPIAITEDSVKMLKNWDLSLPGMLKYKEKNGQDFGLMRIKIIEKNLLEKCRKLDVQFILGEFAGFENETTVCINTFNDTLNLSYDLLIAADGTHSKTRQALSIPVNHLGSAKGAYVVLPNFLSKKEEGEITEILQHGNDFFKIVKLLSLTTIVSFQSPVTASKEQIKTVLEAQGWKKEAQAIHQGRIVEFVENIPISLHQAEIFYDHERSAILVGDSAVSTSFLLGAGLNVALLSIPFVSELYKQFREDKKQAFEGFNLSMQELADKVIEYSLPLLP